jgi:deoxycytidylate deaminase
MKVIIAGLYPAIEWKNDKGHITAITKGGKIICHAEGNLSGVIKHSPRGYSCHSEINAVKKLLNQKDVKNMSKYTLWNIRWDKNGNIKDSKPCTQCQKTLINLGFKNIIFSNQDGTFTKSKISELICKPTRVSR